MNKYVVKQKQSKQFTMMLLAILMVAASTFCLVQGIRRGLRMMLAVGIVGLLFFGLCLLFILCRFVRPKVLLVINRDGINDRSSAISTGFLSWDEITGVRLTNLLNQTFISVDVKDAQSYLANLPFIKSMLIRANMALGYPPISITLQTADHTIEEVLEEMTLYRLAYLNQQERNMKPRGTMPDAIGEDGFFIYKGCSTLMLTYQIKLLTYLAITENKSLMIKVGRECVIHKDLADYIDKYNDIIQLERRA